MPCAELTPVVVGSNKCDKGYPFRGPHALPVGLNHGHSPEIPSTFPSIGLSITGSNLCLRNLSVTGASVSVCDVAAAGESPQPVALASSGKFIVPADGREYTMMVLIKQGAKRAQFRALLRLRSTSNNAELHPESLEQRTKRKILKVHTAQEIQQMQLVFSCDGEICTADAQGIFSVPVETKFCVLYPLVLPADSAPSPVKENNLIIETSTDSTVKKPLILHKTTRESFELLLGEEISIPAPSDGQLSLLLPRQEVVTQALECVNGIRFVYGLNMLTTGTSDANLTLSATGHRVELFALGYDKKSANGEVLLSGIDPRLPHNVDFKLSELGSGQCRFAGVIVLPPFVESLPSPPTLKVIPTIKCLAEGGARVDCALLFEDADSEMIVNGEAMQRTSLSGSRSYAVKLKSNGKELVFLQFEAAKVEISDAIDYQWLQELAAAIDSHDDDSQTLIKCVKKCTPTRANNPDGNVICQFIVKLLEFLAAKEAELVSSKMPEVKDVQPTAVTLVKRASPPARESNFLENLLACLDGYLRSPALDELARGSPRLITELTKQLEQLPENEVETKVITRLVELVQLLNGIQRQPQVVEAVAPKENASKSTFLSEINAAFEKYSDDMDALTRACACIEPNTNEEREHKKHLINLISKAAVLPPVIAAPPPLATAQISKKKDLAVRSAEDIPHTDIQLLRSGTESRVKMCCTRPFRIECVQDDRNTSRAAPQVVAKLSSEVSHTLSLAVLGPDSPTPVTTTKLELPRLSDAPTVVTVKEWSVLPPQQGVRNGDKYTVRVDGGAEVEFRQPIEWPCEKSRRLVISHYSGGSSPHFVGCLDLSLPACTNAVAVEELARRIRRNAEDPAALLAALHNFRDTTESGSLRGLVDAILLLLRQKRNLAQQTQKKSLLQPTEGLQDEFLERAVVFRLKGADFSPLNDSKGQAVQTNRSENRVNSSPYRARSAGVSRSHFYDEDVQFGGTVERSGTHLSNSASTLFYDSAIPESAVESVLSTRGGSSPCKSFDQGTESDHTHPSAVSEEIEDKDVFSYDSATSSRPNLNSKMSSPRSLEAAPPKKKFGRSRPRPRPMSSVNREVEREDESTIYFRV